MTAVRIEPQPESYESTLTTRHLHLHRHEDVNNLSTVYTRLAVDMDWISMDISMDKFKCGYEI